MGGGEGAGGATVGNAMATADGSGAVSGSDDGAGAAASVGFGAATPLPQVATGPPGALNVAGLKP